METQSLLFVARSTAVTGIFPSLKEAGIETGMTETLQGALTFIRRRGPAVVFSEPQLPGYRVADLLKSLADSDEQAPEVVVFTDKGSAVEAQQLMDLGARDYWLAPLTWEKVRTVLPPERPAPAPVPPRPRSKDQTIIGRHPLMARALALARRVAPSRATILIAGESGTGKELFARYIHLHSDRAQRPFVAINCAALPEHLLESELFGHEKGAFTGAVARKMGRFELADGGTLLLDEVSEMDLALQAKLLRALQEGEIDRVGGTETIQVDVRVLATTNRNLAEHVKQGRFRQDLYYRLNVIPLTLPPLRERGDDVLELAEHFVRRFSRDYGVGQLELSDGARQWLRDYDWPGNVRELQNLMERAVLLAGTGRIRRRHFLLEGEAWDVEDMPGDLPGTVGSGEPGGNGASQSDEGQPAGVVPLAEVEKLMILKSLDETSGNRTRAAELLGISVRTLRNKLNEYREQGIVVP